MNEFPQALREYFTELEHKGIQLDIPQKRWYFKKWEKDPNVKKEFPSTIDEAFEVNTDGLYYAQYLSIARAQKRIINIPYDQTIKVHTVWDLGFSDATSIIFFQLSGREVHIIDFIESCGKSLADYIKLLKQKSYIYGNHLAPHDIRNHEFSTGVSRFDTAAKLGINFVCVPDLSLSDGVDATRNIFNRLYFHNGDDVLKLVRHLENYSQQWDRSRGQWSGRPDHDEHSHAADALRYLAVGINYCQDEVQSVTQDEADRLWKQYGRKI